MKRQQAILLSISAVIAVVMLSAGVTLWWAWVVWVVVFACQIGVGLGWSERLAPQPYVPAQQRPDYQLRREAFEVDRQHQAQVDAWRARQQE